MVEHLLNRFLTLISGHRQVVKRAVATIFEGYSKNLTIKPTTM